MSFTQIIALFLIYIFFHIYEFKRKGLIRLIIQQKMSYHNFPFATQEASSFPKPSRSSYPQHIKKMLLQVSRTITQFIQNLSYIYKSNGINFKIKQYHGILMRMLSPFELLTHFGFEQNEKLFLKTHEADKYIRSWNRTEAPLKLEENNDFHEDFDKFSNHIYQEPEQFNQIKEEYQEPIKFTNHDNSSLQYQVPRQPHKIIGREPVLGLDLEIRLCEWIKAQVASKKQTISGHQIAREARNLVNNTRFIASKGWLRRFLGRHPDIQKLLDISKSKSLQQTRRLDGRINSIVFNSNEQEKDDISNTPGTRRSQDKSHRGDWYRAHTIYEMSESGEERRKSHKFGSGELDLEDEDKVVEEHVGWSKFKTRNSTKNFQEDQNERQNQKGRQERQKLNDQSK